jgi:hypothetical protein
VNLGTDIGPIADLNPGEPVHVTGSGVLSADVESELFLTVVVIEPGSQVTANNLVVQTWLELKGDSSLNPTEGGHIELVPELNLQFGIMANVTQSWRDWGPLRRRPVDPGDFDHGRANSGRPEAAAHFWANARDVRSVEGTGEGTSCWIQNGVQDHRRAGWVAFDGE